MARSRVRWFAWVLALLCGWFGLRVAPSHHFQTEAAQWLRDDARQRQLARSVNAGLPRVSADSFTTGAALFDGEWAFGTGVMAALGNAQLALQSPGTRAWTLTATDRALTQATSWEIRAFDRERWGSDPIDEPDPARAHVAYLGYVNLALSLRSALGRSEHDALGEHLTQRLVDAYAASPALLLETYPGEHYPVDNAMAIASVALRGRVDELRGDHPARAAQRRALAKRWTRAARLRYVDPRSGLLLQHAPPTVQDEPSTGLPRGSGSALAAFALNYVDDELSAELQRALRKQLLDPVLGFGVLQEHPSNVPWRDRRSDIDSGPLLFGYSISASGFMVGASRAHGDDGSFVNLMATFDLLGGLERREFPDGVRRSFVSGGPLADAIMLAMLTAPPHHDVGALLERASREAP
ncbi:MAG: hypothetical protein KC766_13280 [Myxococcales bacterium]|nr:hypothetical protein [Myxococcales bacterium]